MDLFRTQGTLVDWSPSEFYVLIPTDNLRGFIPQSLTERLAEQVSKLKTPTTDVRMCYGFYGGVSALLELVSNFEHLPAPELQEFVDSVLTSIRAVDSPHPVARGYYLGVYAAASLLAGLIEGKEHVQFA